MHVIDTGEAPERLIGLKSDAEQRMARERAVAVAVTVHRQIGARRRVSMAEKPHQFRLAIDAAAAFPRIDRHAGASRRSHR